MVHSKISTCFKISTKKFPANHQQTSKKKNTSRSSRPHAFSRGFGAKAGNRARGFSGAAHNFLSYRSDSDNFLSWGHGVMCGHCAIKVHISKDSFKLRHFAALLKPWSYPSLPSTSQWWTNRVDQKSLKSNTPWHCACCCPGSVQGRKFDMLQLKKTAWHVFWLLPWQCDPGTTGTS